MMLNHSCSILSTSPSGLISSSNSFFTSLLQLQLNTFFRKECVDTFYTQGSAKQGRSSAFYERVEPFAVMNCFNMFTLQECIPLSVTQCQMYMYSYSAAILAFFTYISLLDSPLFCSIMAFYIIFQYYQAVPVQFCPPLTNIYMANTIPAGQDQQFYWSWIIVKKQIEFCVAAENVNMQRWHFNRGWRVKLFGSSFGAWSYSWSSPSNRPNCGWLLLLTFKLIKQTDNTPSITNEWINNQQIQIILDFQQNSMKKVYVFSTKEEIKRSNTTSKHLALQKPLQPIPQAHKYYVGAGNNNHLIRKIMSTRKNWEQTNDSKYNFLSFKWQQSNRGYNYQNCSNKKLYKNALNHFQYHAELSNKEYMYRNVLQYCESKKMNAFQFLPLTFILNTLDSNFETQQNNFLTFYNEHNSKKQGKVKTSLQIRKKSISMSQSLQLDKKVSPNYSKLQIKGSYTSPNSKYLWILKPTFYNRGNGVHVFNSLGQLQTLMNKYISGTVPGEQNNQLTKKYHITSNNLFIIQSTSFVIQKYMEQPLLYNGRKFDLRVWVLYTHELKVYLFKEGYMRLSSNVYDLSEDKIVDQSVHLTNNAVQKYNQNYNKYEKGNQLSFKTLKTLLEEKGKNFTTFMEQMKAIIKITAESVKRKLNRLERDNCFEIFGYDFMVDQQNCTPWLIQINTNPCIEQSSPLLEQLIPRMLDDALNLTIDKIFHTDKSNYAYVVQNQSNSQNLWGFIVDLKKS